MKETILLIGHGSPREEANSLHIIGRMLHDALHPGCGNGCVKTAYMEFGRPSIPDAIRECVETGAERLILHPYFLNAGVHVTEDIPEMIRQAKKSYPSVEFVYTEPLGIHNKLIDIILERIRTSSCSAASDIEKRSFDILTEEADLSAVPADRLPIVQRVIHATADFEFMHTLLFHPDAVSAGLSAVRSGKDILTDVEMVRAGINKKILAGFGGRVICGINGIPEETRPARETRAARGIEAAMRENRNIGIIAIGNAPTALLKAIEIIQEGGMPLPLVVGVPVGFVNALESKALLSTRPFPFITNLSRKGGSTVAVAIVNAILKMAEGRP